MHKRTIITKSTEKTSTGGTRTTSTIEENLPSESMDYLRGVGAPRPGTSAAGPGQTGKTKTVTSSTQQVIVDPCTGAKRTVTKTTKVVTPTDNDEEDPCACPSPGPSSGPAQPNRMEASRQIQQPSAGMSQLQQSRLALPRSSGMRAPQTSRLQAPQMSRQEAPQMSRLQVPQMSRLQVPQMGRPQPPQMNRPQPPQMARPTPPAGYGAPAGQTFQQPSICRSPQPPAGPSRLQQSAAGPSRLQPPSAGPSRLQQPAAPRSQHRGVQTTDSLQARQQAQAMSRLQPPSSSFAHSTPVLAPGAPSRQQSQMRQAQASQMQQTRPGAAPAPQPSRVTKTMTKQSVQPAGAPVYQKWKPTERQSLAPPGRKPDPTKQQLEAEVEKTLMEKSQWSTSKVEAAGSKVTSVEPPVEETKTGMEPVIQQLTLEKTVERRPDSERVTKHFTGIDVEGDEARKVDLNIQEIDPSKGTAEECENEVVTVTSSITITPTVKKVTKIVSMKSQAEAKPQLTAEQVSQLIDEEIQEIQDTIDLMRCPAKVLEDSPEKYPLKRKQLKFDLTAENVAALEKTVEPHKSTADDVQPTPTPEVIATIMNCIEKGESALDHLEEEKTKFINLSSVVPGPLKDAVVPVETPVEIDDILTQKEEHMMAAEKVPFADAYTTLNLAVPTPPARTSKLPDLLSQQTPPWGGEYKDTITQSVGAADVNDIKKVDQKKLPKDQMGTVLKRGIEYFLHIEAVPYGSYVQLRGSTAPPWFPGYVLAVPDFQETCSIVRSPSEVFLKAWKAVEPRFYPDESILTI